MILQTMTWEMIKNVAGDLAIIAGILGSTWLILAKGKEVYTWIATKEERKKALDKAIENYSKIDEIHADLKAMQEVMDIIVIDNKNNNDKILEQESKIKCMNEEIKKLNDFNRKQDKQIKNSLEERDILMTGVLGLLDKAIQDGANGTAHAGRDKIVEYMRKKSHNME